jgi:hypothetical protein
VVCSPMVLDLGPSRSWRREQSVQFVLLERSSRHNDRRVPIRFYTIRVSPTCSPYINTVALLCTGVLVLYLSLKGLTKACTMRWGDRGFTSGVYGHPPNIRLSVTLSLSLRLRRYPTISHISITCTYTQSLSTQTAGQNNSAYTSPHY